MSKRSKVKSDLFAEAAAAGMVSLNGDTSSSMPLLGGPRPRPSYSDPSSSPAVTKEEEDEEKGGEEKRYTRGSTPELVSEPLFVPTARAAEDVVANFQLDNLFVVQEQKYTDLEALLAQLEVPKAAAKQREVAERKAEQDADTEAAQGGCGEKAKRKATQCGRRSDSYCRNMVSEKWLLLGALAVFAGVIYFFYEKLQADDYNAQPYIPGQTTNESLNILGQQNQDQYNLINRVWPNTTLSRIGVAAIMTLIAGHILNYITTKRERAEHNRTRQAGEENTLIIQGQGTLLTAYHNSLLATRAELKHLRDNPKISERDLETIAEKVRASLSMEFKSIARSDEGGPGGKVKTRYNPLAVGLPTGVGAEVGASVHSAGTTGSSTSSSSSSMTTMKY